jgi:hypothetical protein
MTQFNLISLSGHGRICPAGTVGARLMVGRLSLEQLVMVRIHCPQPKGLSCESPFFSIGIANTVSISSMGRISHSEFIMQIGVGA